MASSTDPRRRHLRLRRSTIRYLESVAKDQGLSTDEVVARFATTIQTYVLPDRLDPVVDRHYVVEPELWDAVVRLAKARGEGISKMLEQYIREYM